MDSQLPADEYDVFIEQKYREFLLLFDVIELSFELAEASDKVKKLVEDEIGYKLTETKDNNVEITLSKEDVGFIGAAFSIAVKNLEAKKYIRSTLGKNITSEKRWATAAKIAQLKDTQITKTRGYKCQELFHYLSKLNEGLTPDKAAEQVRIRFQWASQEACNKWLFDEITRHKKRDNDMYWPSTTTKTKPPSLFGDLPRPQKSPTKK